MQTVPGVQEHEVFALLENTRCPAHEAGSYLFTSPVKEVCCHDGLQLDLALREIEQFRREGFYLCGYLAYEAAYFLTDRQDFNFNRCPAEVSTPLLHFYAFESGCRLTSDQAKAFLENLPSLDFPAAIRKLSLDLDREAYIERIESLRRYLRAGDSYQVNFTTKYRFEYQGSPIALYDRLRDRQHVEFGAYLHFPEFSILSLSPELFLRKRGGILESKPMKGTWPRGASAEEDREIVAAMKTDPKTLSENVTIVDLIRNDISRVADIGSVEVENLFEVQTYETLHQMISTVKGRLSPDITLGEVLRQLFPCGSVSGAPKIRTLQIIEELEAERRGVYTGAIGYLEPNNDFCLNVPIRTCIAYNDGTAEMGVGGGILYESDPAAEFEECVLKARFLGEINDRFQLLETMRFGARDDAIHHLDRHLGRLAHSANELHFRFDRGKIMRALGDAVAGLRGDHIVRLTLSLDGRVDIQIRPLNDMPESRPLPFVEVSGVTVNSAGFLLRHKTTERSLYESEYEKSRLTGAYDVLFLNESGTLTEASRHNVFVEKNGRLLTSPVSAGLLGGIAREALIEREGARCMERPLTPSDVLFADRIWLTNAVRGTVEVILSPLSRDRLSMVHAAVKPA